jgi:hypothetical protein
MEIQIKRKNMKSLILLLLVAFSFNIYAGTCTSISRTNNSANAVLTSAKYNADLNTSYTNQNAYDGGCVTDGTLEAAALNSTEFAPQLNAVVSGCKVTRSDANTLSVDECFMTVDGNTLQTTSATTVTWGCGSCSAEAASSDYFLYVKTGSTGSTMNLLISTTGPTGDGYDTGSNKAIARFYNNGSSDIDQYSIDQWVVNGFIPQSTGWISWTPTVTGFGTISGEVGRWRRVNGSMQVEASFIGGTATGVTAQFHIPTGYSMTVGDFSGGNMNILGKALRVIGTSAYSAIGGIYYIFSDASDTNSLFYSNGASSNANMAKDLDSDIDSGTGVPFHYTIPIAGWKN